MLPDLFDGWPFWLVFGFLFLGAMLRGQAIYWLARTLTEGTLRRTHPAAGWKLRAARWLQGKDVGRGVDAVRRWGLVAVPLCYLTVGFQTLVLAGAGVVRVAAVPFALAQIPGSIAWAAIYSTIGWAVWEAALLGVAGSPWGIAGVAAVATLLIGTRLLQRRRRSSNGDRSGRSSALSPARAPGDNVVTDKQREAP